MSNSIAVYPNGLCSADIFDRRSSTLAGFTVFEQGGVVYVDAVHDEDTQSSMEVMC
jgi:hypothetical protein